jgi:hypothetical protein
VLRAGSEAMACKGNEGGVEHGSDYFKGAQRRGEKKGGGGGWLPHDGEGGFRSVTKPSHGEDRRGRVAREVGERGKRGI